MSFPFFIVVYFIFLYLHLCLSPVGPFSCLFPILVHQFVFFLHVCAFFFCSFIVQSDLPFLLARTLGMLGAQRGEGYILSLVDSSLTDLPDTFCDNECLGVMKILVRNLRYNICFSWKAMCSRFTGYSSIYTFTCPQSVPLVRLQ